MSTLSFRVSEGVALGGLLTLVPAGIALGTLEGLRSAAIDVYAPALSGFLKVYEYTAVDSFLATYALPAAAAALFVTGFIVGGKAQDDTVHVNGLQLLKDLKQSTAAFLASESAQLKKEKAKGVTTGLKIGDIKIPRQREVGHIVVNGLPGGGKTVFSKSILKQMLENGDRIIMHDSKCDYTGFLPLRFTVDNYALDDEHEKTGNVFISEKKAVLLAPWDERSAWWDISSDITTKQEAADFCAQIWQAKDGGSDFWADTSRRLYTAVIHYFLARKAKTGEDWGFLDLKKAVSSGANHFIELAHKGDPSTKLLIEEQKQDAKKENQTAKNILSNLSSAIGWINDYAESADFSKKTRAFSIKKWAKKETGYEDIQVIVLQNNSNYDQIAQKFFGAILKSFESVASSNDLPEISANEKGIWFLIDEFPQLGAGMGLVAKQLMALGRSRGVRVILMYQDETQLTEIYGKAMGDVLKNLSQTKIWFNTADDTASETAKNFGQREVFKLEERADSQGVMRIERHRIKEDVVSMTDLQSLRSGEAVGGAEFIIKINDVLGKGFVKFTHMPDIREKALENKRFRTGSFEEVVFDFEQKNKHETKETASEVTTTSTVERAKIGFGKRKKETENDDDMTSVLMSGLT
jgi:hypothetical protein